MIRHINASRWWLTVFVVVLLNVHVAGWATGYEEVEYKFVKAARYLKGSRPAFFDSHSFVTIAPDVVTLRSVEGQCTGYIRKVDRTRFWGTAFQSQIDLGGGSNAFESYLRKNFNVGIQDLLDERVRMKAPLQDNSTCRYLAYETIFVTSGSVFFMDDNFVYQFAKRQKTEREQELESGNYRTAGLPVTDKDFNCYPDECHKSRIPLYMEAYARELRNSLGMQKNIHCAANFAKLPPIGDVNMYLVGCYMEYEKEGVDGTPTVDHGEWETYLFTVKNGKENYIRLGDRFTIEKDYAAITVMKGNKPVRYAVKSNGVIIKVEK